MVHVALAVGAALVALAFCLSTFERWLVRRAGHELLWSVALAMFSLAAFAMAAGAAMAWSPATFRLFYLFGAIANVPFLAAGTVALLGGRRWGNPTTWVVALFAAFAAGVMATVPLTHALPRHELAQGSHVLGVLPRVLAAVASGGGALVVFGGAAYSAVRRRADRRLMLGNVLIAGGTALLGASGLLNSVFDAMTGFAVTLVVGISVLFTGFLVASGPLRRRRPTLSLVTATRGGAAFPPDRAGGHQRR
ncbi:MAG TPA: hypothetical protein VFA83_09550 [Acidimicrobiales bacterium]|nr:hypothetical protein [Acidimicrobiales bacterium]